LIGTPVANTIKTLENSRVPILWIYVPHELNSRGMTFAGDYTNTDLNQPYLILTIKSILQHCEPSFTICIIDDNSFDKLIPNWNIPTSGLQEPTKSNVKMMAFASILNHYGGMFVPLSFVCCKNLQPLSRRFVDNEKWFVSRSALKNNMFFGGSFKKNNELTDMISFIQQNMSQDFTNETKFQNKYLNYICKDTHKCGDIEDIYIGMRDKFNKEVDLDKLMSNQYISFCDKMYGILIPQKQLVSRLKYQWFVVAKEKEILECNAIVAKHLLMALGGEDVEKEKSIDLSKYVGFWKTDLNYPNYGLKPNHLGDNVLMVK
jgi:hypothetical protein